MPADNATEVVAAADTVALAFADLRDALNKAALASDAEFDRIYAFRKRAIDLAERWRSGKPAHTPKGSRKQGGER
jgi:hypothetical protein